MPYFTSPLAGAASPKNPALVHLTPGALTAGPPTQRCVPQDWGSSRNSQPLQPSSLNLPQIISVNASTSYFRSSYYILSVLE